MKSRFRVLDGKTTLPDAPGHGIELDEGALQEYEVMHEALCA